MQISVKPANKAEASSLKALKWDLNLFADEPKERARRRPRVRRVLVCVAAVLVAVAACVLPYVRLNMLAQQRDDALRDAGAYADPQAEGELVELKARLDGVHALEDALAAWRGGAPMLSGVIEGVYDNKGSASIVRLTMSGGGTLLIEGDVPDGDGVASFVERLSDAGIFERVDIREITRSGETYYAFTLAATLK